MALYQEVLISLHERGVKISPNQYSIRLKFPPSLSPQSLVTAVADIMSSEELPFDGNYSVMEDNDQNIILELFRSDIPDR